MHPDPSGSNSPQLPRLTGLIATQTCDLEFGHAFSWLYGRFALPPSLFELRQTGSAMHFSGFRRW